MGFAPFLYVFARLPLMAYKGSRVSPADPKALSEWVRQVMIRQFDGNRSEWARRSGVSAGTIANILNSGHGDAFSLVALADAANIPREQVLALLGLIPEPQQAHRPAVLTPKEEAMLEGFRRLPPADRDRLLDTIGLLLVSVERQR